MVPGISNLNTLKNNPHEQEAYEKEKFKQNLRDMGKNNPIEITRKCELEHAEMVARDILLDESYSSEVNWESIRDDFIKKQNTCVSKIKEPKYAYQILRNRKNLKPENVYKLARVCDERYATMFLLSYSISYHRYDKKTEDIIVSKIKNKGNAYNRLVSK